MDDTDRICKNIFSMEIVSFVQKRKEKKNNMLETNKEKENKYMQHLPQQQKLLHKWKPLKGKETAKKMHGNDKNLNTTKQSQLLRLPDNNNLVPQTNMRHVYGSLKDGRSIALFVHKGFTNPKGGVEEATLREQSVGKLPLHDQRETLEEEVPPLEITVAGEMGTKRSPWVNKKLLWFCKSMGVSMEGFKEDILRILVEIENRRCSASPPKASKRGNCPIQERIKN